MGAVRNTQNNILQETQKKEKRHQIQPEVNADAILAGHKENHIHIFYLCHL